jgi:hypothetical protein
VLVICLGATKAFRIDGCYGQMAAKCEAILDKMNKIIAQKYSRAIGCVLKFT